MNAACTIEILPRIFTLQGAHNNKPDGGWKQLGLHSRAVDPVHFLCEGLCMALYEWNVWDLENTGIFVSRHSFSLLRKRSLETRSRQVGVYTCTCLCTCVLIWCTSLCVYMYVWDIIHVNDFVSEQSFQTGDTLMYLNILKRLFFLNIKRLIQPPPQQPAACAGWTWISWKWICSSGEISFFLAGPVPRERFRVTGQPPATHQGWICANHFLHLMGGIVRQSGVILRTAPFEAARDWETFLKPLSLYVEKIPINKFFFNFNR